jgi:catechol 2,3-dioxygenase-like lactoylglutathione lyase family enzyme
MAMTHISSLVFILIVASGLIGCSTTKAVDGPSVLGNATADHISVGVDDYEASIAWYRDKLGFEVEKEWTVDGLLGVKLAYLIKNGFRIEILYGGKGEPVTAPEDFQQHFNRKGFGHLCFYVEDVDLAMSQLNRRGVPTFVPAKDYPVGAERRVAFVLDNSGNVIEFAGPLKGE